VDDELDYATTPLLPSISALDNQTEDVPMDKSQINLPLLLSPREAALMSRTIQNEDLNKKKVGMAGISSPLFKESAANLLRNNPAHKQQSQTPFNYVSNMSSKEKEKLRVAPMTGKVIDLTHDTLPEVQWRPIRPEKVKVPSLTVLEDKVLLRDWETTQQDEFY